MTSTVRVKQKNGDVYVMERQSVYDPDKGYSRPIGSRMIGKIPAGSDAMVPTRPYRRKRKEPAEQAAPSGLAGSQALALDRLLGWIGEASGIDEDLCGAARPEDAQKILALARYHVATGARTLSRFGGWQAGRETPCAQAIDAPAREKLFEKFGCDAEAMRSYFRRRAARFAEAGLLAFEAAALPGRDGSFEEAALEPVRMLALCEAQGRQPLAFAQLPANLTRAAAARAALAQLPEIAGQGKTLVVTDAVCRSADDAAGFVKSGADVLMAGDIRAPWIQEALEKHKEELEQLSSLCPQDGSVHGVTAALPQAPGESGPALHLHLFLSRFQAGLDAVRLNASVVALREQVAQGEELSEAARRRAGRFLVRQGRRTGFNEDAVRRARRDCGCFALVSTRAMEAGEALALARFRREVEAALRVPEESLEGKDPEVCSPASLAARTFVQLVALGYRGFFLARHEELKRRLEEPGDGEQADPEARKSLRRRLAQSSADAILEGLGGDRGARPQQDAERDALLLSLLGAA
ncbi:MAG: hypothetical protein HUK26_04785 [Duodenibacillus sp.]|nr:hypothetical protein [Duodenibacillus sp.]